MKSSRQFFRHFGSMIFVSGSGFYLTQITPISPIYITSLIGVVLIFVGLFDFKKSIRFDLVAIFSTTCLIYVSATHGTTSDPSAIVGYCFSIISGLIAYWALPNNYASISTAKISIRTYVNVSILLATIEAVYRITNPSFDRWNDSQIQRMSDENLMFYAYKISSIMYQDSNFVGMWILFTFLYTLFGPIQFNKYVKTFLAILVMASLSRAAIIAMMIGIFLKLYIKSKFKIMYVLGFSVAALWVLMVIVNDESFMTKFEIMHSVTIYAVKSDVFSLLIGSGIGNSVHVLGDRASHGLLMTLFVETGLLGTLLYLLLVMAYLNKAPSMRPVIGIYLIASFSLASFATPYIFCLLAITAKNLNINRH